MDKKILIISNEPISNTSSNGRTLRNFLLDIPKEQIAQFFLHGTPDEQSVSSFYQVSDNDALNALLMRKPKAKKTQQTKQNVTTTSTVAPKKIRRNCKTMVLRDLVWRSYAWWKKDFDKFIKDFNPDVLLFQAGDAPFMFAITLKIAKKYKLPIVMYNSENYVLKKTIYSLSKDDRGWHKILHNSLKRIYKKLMKKVSFCIYSTEYLEKQYQKAYPHEDKSCALYTVSELSPLQDNSDNERFNLLYCGNLGVGRVIPLDEIAKTLYEVDKTATLDIYGAFASERGKKYVCKNPNVRYGGVVPYEQVKQLMSEASMLIHTENAERIEHIKCAFSTKIADSLASGRPFLVYASNEYPFVEYLKQNNCAHIACNSDELKDILQKCITDKNYCTQYEINAIKTAQMNHDVQKNCIRMIGIFDKIKRL